MNRLILAAGLAGGMIAATAVAEAAPKWLRLSYVEDTSTAMTIAWNTDGPEGTEVRYGTAPGNLTQTATGTSFVANSSLGHVHEVTVKGLAPRTKYYYSAGSAGALSAEQSFTTGPAQSENCGSLKFVFLGDNRPDKTLGGGENWPQILGQASMHQPEFVFNGGDLVIDGDQIDQWKDFLAWTSSVSAVTPFMPVIGNHDTGPGQGDTANYNQLFALPRSTGPNGSGTEDYYYFTYGNAIFVILSTEGFKDGTPLYSKQAAWLDEVLTNNPRRWKFVAYHKPTYTHEAFFSISHAPNENGQNEAFVTVIDKHHVDVVFTSHNHWYERFEPSACAKQGKPGSSSACSVGANNFDQGTVYFVSGGAGAFTIPGFLCGSEKGRAKCSGDHHYILLDIKDEVLKIETWGAFPQSNKVIDSVTITKSAVNCVEPPDAGPDAPPDAAEDAEGDAAPVVDAGSDGSPQVDASIPDSGSDTGTSAEAGPSTPSAPSSSGDDGGCGCRTSSTGSNQTPLLVLIGLALGLGWRRRERP
jgi:MYXO-CTERM domain-containing protein